MIHRLRNRMGSDEGQFSGGVPEGCRLSYLHRMLSYMRLGVQALSGWLSDQAVLNAACACMQFCVRVHACARVP